MCCVKNKNDRGHSRKCLLTAVKYYIWIDMKNSLIIFFLLLNAGLFAQDQNYVDSLQRELDQYYRHQLELRQPNPSQSDSVAVKLHYFLAMSFIGSNPDSLKFHAQKSLYLAERINNKKGIGYAWYALGIYYHQSGNYDSTISLGERAVHFFEETETFKGLIAANNLIANAYTLKSNSFRAMEKILEGLKAAEKLKDTALYIGGLLNAGNVYYESRNYQSALEYYNRALRLQLQFNENPSQLAALYINLGITNNELNNVEAAKQNLSKGLEYSEMIGQKMFSANAYETLGLIHLSEQNFKSAEQELKSALVIRNELNDRYGLTSIKVNLADLKLRLKDLPSANAYAREAIKLGESIGAIEKLGNAYRVSYQIDSARGDYISAFRHHQLFKLMEDSVSNEEKRKNLTRLEMQYEFNRQRTEDSLQVAGEKQLAALDLEKQKGYTVLGIIGILLALVTLLFVYLNYKNQKIAHEQLRMAQEQIIQAEKMAAFGVFAQRMAHEIQNPLNFILNFSEISQEIAKEIKPARSEAEQLDLLNDNLQRIRQHGIRADDIIKKLQHHANTGTAHEFFDEGK